MARSRSACGAVLLSGALGVVLIAGAGDGSREYGKSSGRFGTVRRGALVSSVQASGSVTSAGTMAVGFGTPGKVVAIDVLKGDMVLKGEVLAHLDNTAAVDKVTVAKADLDAAGAAYANATSGDRARARSSYASAKKTYDAAVRTLEATVLTAPMSGVVTAVHGAVGEPVSGSDFMTLSDAGHLQVAATVAEAADAAELKIGQAATVTCDELPGGVAAGKVTAVDAPGDSMVTVTLDKYLAGVRLGAPATVRVIVASAGNVLYVPAAAVRTIGGRSLVTVVRHGRRMTQDVQVGIRGDLGIQIISGLDEGDRVVLPPVPAAAQKPQ